MENDVVLLLTGTIRPDGMIFTAIQDIEIRKAQYLSSIRYWLETTNLNIIFVENSNTDVTYEFKKEISTGRIEILHFSGNNFDKNLGKGLGELKCIEYACIHSKFIKKAKFIFKVTGRYKVINFNTFLQSYIDNTQIDIMVDFKWNLTFCDSRFFGFTAPFVLDYLVKYKDTVNDSNGIYLEHILAKAALLAIVGGYLFRPLVSLPRIEGYSASTGVQYNSKLLHWFRYKFEYNLKYRSFGLGNLPWI